MSNVVLRCLPNTEEISLRGGDKRDHRQSYRIRSYRQMGHRSAAVFIGRPIGPVQANDVPLQKAYNEIRIEPKEIFDGASTDCVLYFTHGMVGERLRVPH